MKNVNLDLGLKILSANSIVFVGHLKEARSNGLSLDDVITNLEEQIAPEILARVPRVDRGTRSLAVRASREVTATENTVLTPKQIAEASGYQLSTVYYWVNQGHLRTSKVGSHFVAKIADVNRFFAKKGIKTVKIVPAKEMATLSNP